MLFYSIGLKLYVFVLNVLAVLGNAKAKLWVEGRKQQKLLLQSSIVNHQFSLYWFHCASLGEYEQGKPLIKHYKSTQPEVKILVTFFSPSGYEQKKNDALLDYVFYLPIDSRKNAQQILDTFQPTKVFFIKYDFWYFYFNEIQKRDIPLYVVSGLFRKNQWFFKWYGSWFLDTLKKVNHFFVQDENSKQLLNEKGISNNTIAGDTRFDNVTSEVLTPNLLIEKFCKENEVIVLGSSWPIEEEMMQKVFTQLLPHVKLLIVPHDISNGHIHQIKDLYKQYQPDVFSEGTTTSRVMIVDAIGSLKYAYSQASIAIVGGGFKNALHNILEPAVCGLPVLFGTNTFKYPEAAALIKAGGGFSFENTSQLQKMLLELLNYKKYKSVGLNSQRFVESNKGATKKILEFYND